MLTLLSCLRFDPTDALDEFEEPVRPTPPTPPATSVASASVNPPASSAAASAADTLPASLNVEDIMRELGLSGGDAGTDSDMIKQMEAALKFMQENPDFAKTIQELAKSLPDDLGNVAPRMRSRLL